MSKFTFKNGQTLQMKAMQHSEFASEETHCYEAKLYLDGKLFAYVSNQGYGGADRQDPADGFTYQDIRDLDQRCKDEMPEWRFDEHVGTTDLEMWCQNAVNDLLSMQDMKRAMRSKVIYVLPEEPRVVRQISWKGCRKIDDRHINHVQTKYPNYQLLNTMSVDDAFAIWKGAN